MKRVLALAAVAVLVGSGVTMFGPRSVSWAGPGDGALTVRVVRDVNGNGTYEAALELGVRGAQVTVTDDAGHTANGVTGVDGTLAVDLTTLTGGRYRVQVTPPAGSVLVPAPAGAGLVSNTEFVDVSGGHVVTMTTGLWNPADYCQDNPALATACERADRRSGGRSNVNPAARSLVTFPFDQRGTTPPTQIANQADLGTIYGLAYRKQDKRIFAGAFAKRLTSYGPGGPGAVYVVPSGGGPATLFTTVPNAGTATHAPLTDPTFDGAFYPVPGTQSLGDIDISEDGTELYVVNMNDKQLYVYDATGATAAAPKASYPIPAGACPNPADWRPGALGVRDGVVYVGGVCSGQSTGQASDMKAVVYTFQGGSFSGPVLTQPLDFLRGWAFSNRARSDHWNPWTDTWAAAITPPGFSQAFPMPLMTDIGVENNGDLVLGFRDRFGDMGSSGVPAPDGSGGLWGLDTGGDINRACLTAAGTYDWEGTGICPNNHVYPNGGAGQNRSVVEYYPGEFINGHSETAQGAIALVPGEQRMPATVMDPIVFDTGGVGWFDRTDGDMANAQASNAYEITTVKTEGFGKANGLGDLEALCDMAPVQVGNRVWFDANQNGVQDPGEVPVAGVRVIATPVGGGPALPAKTTDARGEYYFGAADGLLPNSQYVLTFDYSGVDLASLPGAPASADLKWTAQAAGADRTVDSNVDASGTTTLTTGGPGTVDHTIDAGIEPVNQLGDYVWVDADRDGVQDPGEAPVPGVTVTLLDGNGNPTGRTATTDAAGKYLFKDLPDGAYQASFDLTTAAGFAGYEFTKPDQGDDAADSDVDPTTGRSQVVTLGQANREYLSLDAGIRVVLHPAIIIDKIADRTVVRQGDQVMFMITVKNAGDVTLTNVTVTDQLSPACSQTFATLAVAAVQTYTCTMTAPAADFTNTAAVTGNDADGKLVTDTHDATVDVLAEPDVLADPSAPDRMPTTGTPLRLPLLAGFLLTVAGALTLRARRREHN